MGFSISADTLTMTIGSAALAQQAPRATALKVHVRGPHGRCGREPFLVMRDRGLLPIYFRGHDIDVRFIVRGESDRDGSYGIRGPLVRLAPVRLRRLDGLHDLGRFLFRP
jgi:hypothetical protein